MTYLNADHVVFTPVALRRELIDLGYTDRGLAKAVDVGVMAKPRRGAYVDGCAWREASDEDRYALRVRSVLRQSCAEAVASHVSALRFLDAPLWGLSLKEVHTTRFDGKCGRSEAGVRQHRGGMIDGDAVRVGDLAVSSPQRAALEVATMGTVEQALVVLNHFLHRGDFSPSDIRHRYEEGMDHWPSSLPSDLVLRLGDPRIESVGESRTFYFLWSHHFPMPELQLEIADGAFLAYLDFAFPDLGVWLEFDGKEKYVKHRRPGESYIDAVIREKQRESRISELTGMLCVRITWADLENPVQLDRRIRGAIASVAKARGRAS